MKPITKKYICCYYGGSGIEYQDGTWERKDTAKTILMTKISDYGAGVFANHEIGEKIRVGNKTGNPIREYGNGTFTIYFNQDGTPYYFVPL